MKAEFIDVNSLVTISDYLEALATAEEVTTGIKLQLQKFGRSDQDWHNRATHSLSQWQAVRRIITARLAVLRQREKEQNMQLHQQRNDYLIDELSSVIPPSVFGECVERADMKMGASDVEG
jgi:hypothetical protein